MPLSGIRVVDLTRILAGPFCTQLLADLGAEVIKVEAPGGGDPVRGQGAIRDGLSWYFAQFNRNKVSITLDLYQDEGKAVLADLIRRADVLVENYRPGVLEKMGFGEARLRELNSGLVVASVNGFGSSGPYVDRPAFDFIAQAMSGFMSTTGEADGEPMRAGPPISDLIAGLYAALGAVSALLARERGTTAGGQRLEASLVNGLISMLAYASASFLATGRLPERTGNDHPVVYPYGLFHASDGEIAVAASTEVTVRRFLGALNLSHLLDDPDFATNQARMDNRERLKALINDRTRARTVEEWIEALNGAGVPCGRIMNLAEVFSDPQVLAQEMVLEAEHPGHRPVHVTGFPIIHESGGRFFESHFAGPVLPGLRLADTGQLLTWSIAGAVLVGILTWAFRNSTRQAIGFGGVFALILALLAVFGGGVDMIHIALRDASRTTDRLLIIVEDGGEMLAIALAFASALLLYRLTASASGRGQAVTTAYTRH